MTSGDVQSTIHQAIESARYNEAVIVSVSDEESNAREIVLVACLDRTNGGIVWRDASITTPDSTADSVGADNTDCNYAARLDDVGILRHLRTKLWAVPMLNDHVRNEMYNRTVRDACCKAVQKRIQDPDNDGVIRILDIGSGTGLIAMMAAKHCRDAIVEAKKSQPDMKCMKVQVTSCEMASAMARLARMTIDENKSVLQDGSDVDCGLVVVECHSTDGDFTIQDARFEEQQQQAFEPKKADICTSELLDSELLGEGVIPSLRDAWERHLKPDSLVLPMAARVVAVLVEGCHRPESSSQRALNGASAFYGPDMHSLKHASGGVWLATTAQKDNADTNNHDGILLGVECNASVHSAVGGINIPLHAEAILEHDNRLKSVLADPLQEYDGYSLATDVAAKIGNDGANKHVTTSSVGIRALTDPKTVLTIDFASGSSSFPPSDGQTLTTTFVPTENGIVDGVLFWWELDLGPGTSNTYSTEPIGCFERKESSVTNGMQWQDHWQQSLFLFCDGGRNRVVEIGKEVQVNTSHNDYSVSFGITETYDTNETRPTARRKLNDGTVDGSDQFTLNKHVSPARALQLNDSRRTSVLRDAILFALSVKGADASLLDLSDMGLCAMIAAVAGKAACVTSLESSTATLAATVAQLGNNLPREGSTFQVIQALSENVTKDYIAGGQAEIVVAEPYYQMLEGWHIQEALNYFYLVRSFRSRGLISESAVSIPAVAFVMACVVEFRDFSNAYGPVGREDEMVTGFQHKTVNRYGNRYHTYDVSLPLWQYRCKRLSEPCCVAKINYEGNALGIEDGHWTSAKFVTSGSADAVVFWVDYLCRSPNGMHEQASTKERFDIISTSTTSHRQLIRKVHSVFISLEDVNNGAKFCCRSKLDVEDSGGVDADHCFSYKFVHENNKGS